MPDPATIALARRERRLPHALALVLLSLLASGIVADDPFPDVKETNPDGSLIYCALGKEGIGKGKNCELIVRLPEALKVARTRSPVCRTAGKHGVVVDVGARGGAQTQMALDQNFSVVAVDCQQSEFVRLVQMFGGNEDVVLVNACANRAGEYGFKELYQASGSSSMSRSNIMDHGERRKVEQRKKVTVLSTPLDPYVLSLQKPVCGIKVDVQGLEGAVLDGLSKTIAKWRPVVHMEYDSRWRFTNSSGAVQDMLARGYSCKPKACKICDMVCWPTKRL